MVKCQNCQELKKIEAKEESARFIAKTLDTQLYYCKAKSQLLAEDDVIDNLPCKDYKPKEIVCVKMSLCARGE